MNRIVVLSALLLLIAFGCASGQQSTWEDVEYPMGQMALSVGDNIGSINFYELGELRMEDNRDFLYYVPMLTWGSFVKRDLSVKDHQWSFALLINWAVSTIHDNLLKGEKSDGQLTSDSKWKYVLFAPNCFVARRIGDRSYFSYGNSTDYLFKRGGDNPPGILIRPHIGFTFQVREAYEKRERNFPALLSIHTGPAYFWNFDGPSKFDSWMVSLSMIGGILD